MNGRMDGQMNREKKGTTHHHPIHISNLPITIKPIIHTRNSRPPHQDHHSQIIKLIPKGSDSFAMVR
jgi:hypothetical protein